MWRPRLLSTDRRAHGALGRRSWMAPRGGGAGRRDEERKLRHGLSRPGTRLPFLAVTKCGSFHEADAEQPFDSFTGMEHARATVA